MALMTPIAREAFTLCDAETTDVASLAPLYLDLLVAHGEAGTLPAAAERLEGKMRHGYRITMLCLDARPVGYAMWFDLGDDIFIRHFAIGRDHQGQGLGRMFLERLVRERLPARDMIRLDASVEPARRFWGTMGFEEKARVMRRPMAEMLQEIDR
ncbi:MAG: GNAT family N-acetyltransferase [Pseudomonadota bacterium]